MARRPEALPLAASVAAWGAMIGLPVDAKLGGHAGHTAAVLVMVVATMGPLTIPLVRMVASTTPWWVVFRAVPTAFVAFLAVWAAVALGLHIAAETLIEVGAPAAALASSMVAGCALAGLGRRRSERLLHCLPVSAPCYNGAKEFSACARYGALAALRCGWICAAAMFAMVLVPASTWVMASLTGLAVAERVCAPARRTAVGLGYGVLAAAILLWAS